MNKILPVISALIFFSIIDKYASAQGCIAIRNFGSSCSLDFTKVDSALKPEAQHYWQFGAGFRYFKSFRHFRGTDEQKDRLVNHNEVINHAYTLDLTATYVINDRWSANATLPLVYFTRSSLYEHGLKERHSTQSYGLSDMRLGAQYWLLNPQHFSKGNIQFGLGLKLPTGNSDFKDTFYNVGPDGTNERRPVDQSIQPGDGGLGFYTALDGFKKISHQIYAYGNCFYLFNPRNTNGTRTYRETLNAMYSNEAIMSVPDQYLARTGANYYLLQPHGLAFGLGARMEGIPVNDLLGKSDGFRRPGYVLSAEPAVSYLHKNNNFNISVPFALLRNRLQSVTDKENELKYNKAVHGDAAFADYLININYIRKL